MILPRRRAIFNDTFANKQDTTFLNITNSAYITFNKPGCFFNPCR